MRKVVGRSNGAKGESIRVLGLHSFSSRCWASWKFISGVDEESSYLSSAATARRTSGQPGGRKGNAIVVRPNSVTLSTEDICKRRICMNPTSMLLFMLAVCILRLDLFKCWAPSPQSLA
jgi:hypothetical protein